MIEKIHRYHEAFGSEAVGIGVDALAEGALTEGALTEGRSGSNWSCSPGRWPR
ncbi:hypothetical protein [Streptomyces sp. CBMA123]|uniref:hypothetical protein n=1 Tax=Streptomyces sp. CBMA123 TaxID=1896313 RepID=UPI001661DC19|nr:hypothetical protein [Streptomyces sp. CBMA123]